MRRAVLPLALLLSLQCYAADDKPLVLKAGDPAPVSGVLLPDSLAILRAREQAGCRVERDQLKTEVTKAHEGTVSVVWVVVLGVVAAGVGVGVGYGVTKATAPK